MIPFSKFQQLSLLCLEDRLVGDEFSRFNVVAVLIHDGPECGVRSAVRANFGKLHECTGPRFGVISFLEPPSWWLRQNRERAGRRDLLMYGSAAENDDEVFLEALRQRLCLPELPALVLTSSLMSDTYAVMTPEAGSIISLLEEIGNLAARRDAPIEAGDEELQHILSRYGNAVTCRTDDGEPLARNLADMTAISALNGDGAADDFMRKSQIEDSRRWVGSTLRRLKREMRNSVSSDYPDDEMERTRGRFYDYRYYAQHERFKELREQRMDTASDRYMIDMRPFLECEKETKRQLQRYRENILARPYKRMLLRDWDDRHRGPENDGLDADLFPENDYSDEALCLGKAIEHEVNASVVQLIRRDHFGIPMPDYFMKYCPPAQACNISTDGNRITFNFHDRRYDALKSVPIGQVNASVRKLRTVDPPALRNLGVLARDEYLKLSEGIANRRNQASHSGALSEEDFEEMLNLFKILVERYLNEYLMIKSMVSR